MLTPLQSQSQLQNIQNYEDFLNILFENISTMEEGGVEGFDQTKLFNEMFSLGLGDFLNFQEGNTESGQLLEILQNPEKFFGTGEGLIENVLTSRVEVNLQASPSIPGPNETVKLSISSNIINLQESAVSWYVNNSLVSSGIGTTSHSIKTGSLGERIRVDVVVLSSSFGEKTVTRTFVPGEVNVLWEALDSYTPPFYRGKALPTSETAIRLVAMPENGGEINSDNLMYEWIRNNRKRDLISQSGYGKNSALLKVERFRSSERFTVNVSSLDRSFVSQGKTSFQKETPEILFYRNHPLQGVVYERAYKNNLKTHSAQGELNVVTEPFFFSAYTRKSPSLEYEWRLDNRALETGLAPKKGEITLVMEEGSRTQANLSLLVRHGSVLSQSIKQSLSVEMTQDPVDPFR